MNLYKKLFSVSDAKLPELVKIKGAEYALESTMAIRLLTIGAGGLAIAGAAATAIGYRGYKDPANKEIGFLNKLGVGFKTQAKKDAGDFKKWTSDKYNKAKDYFKKKSDRENKKDQLDSTIEDKKIESPIDMEQKEELKAEDAKEQVYSTIEDKKIKSPIEIEQKEELKAEDAKEQLDSIIEDKKIESPIEIEQKEELEVAEKTSDKPLETNVIDKNYYKKIKYNKAKEWVSDKYNKAREILNKKDEKLNERKSLIKDDQYWNDIIGSSI